MKIIKYLFIIMFMFIGINNALAFDNTVKVYDYAQILSDNEEINLKSQINDYITKYNTDMIIVTVKYYNQVNLQDYMNQFYYQNGFGIGNNRDGIIIAIDLKNKKEVIDIKTLGNTVNLYSDNEIKLILDKINSEKEYYNKLSSFINYSSKYIYETDLNNEITIDNNFSSINWFSIIMISMIVPTIVVAISIFKNKTVLIKDDANYYVKKDSVAITTRDDKFITTNTKKTRLNSNK